MQSDSICTRLPKRAYYRAVHAWRSPHIVEAQCGEIRLQFSSENRIGEDIFANAFERAERRLLKKILRPGQKVLDVGANIGFYTCMFAQSVGPSGRVIAFEPTPSTFTALQRNVRLNGFQDRVECHCCALSDTTGTASMNTFPEGGDVYNSLGTVQSLGGSKRTEVIDVDTVTLDRSVEEMDFPNGVFIKIDVEGFEQQVIRGGANFLKTESRLAMMVELYEPLSQQCGASTLQTLDLLESYGFEAYCMTPEASLGRFDVETRQKLADGLLPPDVFFFKTATRPSWTQ